MMKEEIPTNADLHRKWQQPQRWTIIILSSCLAMGIYSERALTELQAGPQPDDPSRFDFDGNGAIDSNDLIQFLQHWGLRDLVAPTPSPTPTPPPGSNEFEGSYEGTFSGDASGTLTLAIDAMGDVTGITQTPPDDTTEVVGAVSLSGAIYTTILEGSTVVGFVFGQLNGNEGSGQWADDEGNRGNWNMTRSP